MLSKKKLFAKTLQFKPELNFYSCFVNFDIKSRLNIFIVLRKLIFFYMNCKQKEQISTIYSRAAQSAAHTTSFCGPQLTVS